MKIIDAHSHIEYITHDFQSDVVGTVCCAKNESEWNVLVDMADKDNKIFPAFGIHPWFIENIKDGFENRLNDLLKTNRRFLVGEIGLDKYKPNMEHQIDVFKKQLDIAIKLKRTIIIHCVGAWDKILQILKQYKKHNLPIIVAHGFNGSDEILQQLLKNYDVMFSFSKIDKGHYLHRIEQIDSDKILVETDAKHNIILCDLIKRIQDIKKENNIDNIIYNNVQRIFNNGQIA